MTDPGSEDLASCQVTDQGGGSRGHSVFWEGCVMEGNTLALACSFLDGHGTENTGLAVSTQLKFKFTK